MLYLELNDWALTVWNESGATLYAEPAAAAFLNDKLIFGRDALKASRNNPQAFASHYLDRLGSEPLNGSLGTSQNQADLMFQQILELGIKEDTAVIVPSNYSNEKLGIFLGIAEKTGLKVRGFIDSPLSYALETPASQEFHVLDIGLHEASITNMSVEGSTRVITNSQTIESLGFSSLIDGWLNVIADEFIQKTRFDPFHFAETEQQLFDAVIAYLDTNSTSDVKIAISYNGQERSVDIPQHRLSDKLLSRLQTIDLNGVDWLALHPRAIQIPSIQSALKSLVPKIIVIDPSQLQQNLMRLSSSFSSESVNRITHGESSYDLVGTEEEAVSHSQIGDRMTTHLLLKSHAYRYDDPRFDHRFSESENRPAPGETVELESKTYTAISVD
tara:strand:+ start:132 stop:1292 length:1161 start_codon:yes stop_codon:yes gene_type:complete